MTPGALIEAAAALGEAIRAAPRPRQFYNAIGDAIAHATALIAAAPFRSEDRVIDVAGDRPDIRSFLPAPTARARLCPVRRDLP